MKRTGLILTLLCSLLLASGYSWAKDNDNDWYQGHQGHWQQQNKNWQWQSSHGNDWYQGQQGSWYQNPNGWDYQTNNGRQYRRTANGGYQWYDRYGKHHQNYQHGPLH
jgi:hypothetical protein